MRSSILFTAAFAATALAKPVFDKRGEVVVTDNELVYVTEVVTVTAGDEPIAAATVAPTKARGRGGWGRNKKHRHTRTGGSSAAPAPTSEAPAPAPSSEEPAPAPTSEAPAPTSEAPAPAPTSYDEPAPAPATSEAPAPAPSAPASTGVATDYKAAVVQHHNYHRANHSAPDLTWSDSLATSAKQLAMTCKFAHGKPDGGNYGQNIAAGVDASEIASIISDMFYNGEAGDYANYYGVADGPPMVPEGNSPFEKVGHFTQIVWKNTQSVGCATVDCSTQSAGSVYTNQGGNTYGPSKMNSFTVCNYSPAGNFGGEYANNVGKPLGQPSVNGLTNVESVDQRKTNYISP